MKVLKLRQPLGPLLSLWYFKVDVNFTLKNTKLPTRTYSFLAMGRTGLATLSWCSVVDELACSSLNLYELGSERLDIVLNQLGDFLFSHIPNFPLLFLSFPWNHGCDGPFCLLGGGKIAHCILDNYNGMEAPWRPVSCMSSFVPLLACGTCRSEIKNSSSGFLVCFGLFCSVWIFFWI